MDNEYKIIIVGETGLPSIMLSDDMNSADENARALNKAVSDHFGCDYLVSPFVMTGGHVAELKTYCNNIHITLELVNTETPTAIATHNGETVSFALVGFNTEHYENLHSATESKAVYTLHTFTDGINPQTVTQLLAAIEIVSSTTIATNYDGSLLELYIMSSTSSESLMTNVNEVIPVLNAGTTFNPFPN